MPILLSFELLDTISIRLLHFIVTLEYAAPWS